MTKAKIIRYPKGNHTSAHLLMCGSTYFHGTKTQCIKELTYLRKKFRREWKSLCTNDKQREYVDYMMQEFTLFVLVDGMWKKESI